MSSPLRAPLVVAAVLFALVHPASNAGSPPPPGAGPGGGGAGAAAERPGIRLGDPEIVKLDQAVRAPVAIDLDGNGMRDLALLNNDQARIDLLYRYAADEEVPARKGTLDDARWRPDLDRGRFHRRGIPTGERMYALAAGDFDGDGRADLAYTAADEGLKILYQHAEDEWRERLIHDRDEPGQWRSSLRAVDLDGDGGPELAMLGRDTLVILARGPSGLHDQVRRYPLSDEDSFGLTLADINRDGRQDILYLARNSRFALKLRLQDAQGGFGAELGLRADTPRAEAALAALSDQPATIATLDRKTGMIHWHAIAPPGDDGDIATPLWPTRYAAPARIPGADAYALGDFDGDGDRDIAIADRESALIWLYTRLPDNRLGEPRSFPAFAGVHSLHAADLDGDGGDELYLAAAEEEGFGVTRLTAEGRLAYPRRIEVEGEPLAIAAVAGEASRLACLVKRKPERGVALLARDPQGDWRESDFIPLKELKGDPSGMRLLDFDGDGHRDLIIFARRTPAIPLLADGDGGFVRIAANAGFRPGLFDNLAPGDLIVADSDGDGEAELLVLNKGGVKALRRKPGGLGEVIDQFTPLNREARVTSAVMRDIDGDAQPELLLKTEKSDQLEIHGRDESNVYRYRRGLSLGAIEVLDTRADQEQEILYLGSNGFLAAHANGGLTLQPASHYESPIEDVEYGKIAFGDLNGDGAPELIAMDDRNSRVLDILVRKDDAWHSSLRFAVFDKRVDDGNQDGSREPRELLVEDLDGDGRDDIIILAHDRVLFYPALAAPE